MESNKPSRPDDGAQTMEAAGGPLPLPPDPAAAPAPPEVTPPECPAPVVPPEATLTLEESSVLLPPEATRTLDELLSPSAAEAAPAVSAEPQRLEAAAAARAELLALFGTDARPKSQAVTAAAEKYADAAQGDAAAAEWERIRAALAEAAAHVEAADADKFAAVAAAVERQTAAYEEMFARLPMLDQVVTAELDQMREDDSLQAVPDELRDVLLNYKKGVQIIQRMLGRLPARRKALDGTLPAPAAAPALREQVPPADDWPEELTAFATAFHTWRSDRATALRDAQRKAEGVKRDVAGFVTALLGPLDGVEAGARNEPDVQARVAPQRDGHAAVIGAWLGAYTRLDAAVQPFFAATGLSPVGVEPGTPFQPDTMEPGGTVADPARRNEDVASVMRRGYALHGEPVRPVLVEVVVNPPAPPAEG